MSKRIAAFGSALPAGSATFPALTASKLCPTSFARDATGEAHPQGLSESFGKNEGQISGTSYREIDDRVEAQGRQVQGRQSTVRFWKRIAASGLSAFVLMRIVLRSPKAEDDS